MSRAHTPLVGAAIAACLIGAAVCCVVTLAGYTPRLSAVDLIVMPGLLVTAGLLARGRRWE